MLCTTAFIQWKGTDVCMDISCAHCNTEGHYDGINFGRIKCPGCGTVFALPIYVALTETDPHELDQEFQADEDD